MLGPNCENAAKEALQAYPYGLQIGGGITMDNALLYLDQYHASHVIVTSYVFTEGNIDFARLEALSNLVGKQRLVIDLSCRKKKQPSIDDNNTTTTTDDDTTQRYYVVTNKWTKYTDFEITLVTCIIFNIIFLNSHNIVPIIMTLHIIIYYIRIRNKHYHYN